MPIEQESSGNKTVYTLSDGEVAVELEIVAGNPMELNLWTEDVNLVAVAEDRAEGWNPTKPEFMDAVEDGLDLILDHVEIVDAGAYEAAFLLSADSIVVAGERWGGPEQLYPA